MRLVMQLSAAAAGSSLAYTINRLGGWFGLLALVLAVYDHTHSALAVAALLFAGQALPALIVPAVVARVEASKRRGELSGLYLFEALVTAGLAVLLSHFSLPVILALVGPRRDGGPGGQRTAAFGGRPRSTGLGRTPRAQRVMPGSPRANWRREPPRPSATPTPH